MKLALSKFKTSPGRKSAPFGIVHVNNFEAAWFLSISSRFSFMSFPFHICFIPFHIYFD